MWPTDLPTEAVHSRCCESVTGVGQADSDHSRDDAHTSDTLALNNLAREALNRRPCPRRGRHSQIYVLSLAPRPGDGRNSIVFGGSFERKLWWFQLSSVPCYDATPHWDGQRFAFRLRIVSYPASPGYSLVTLPLPSTQSLKTIIERRSQEHGACILRACAVAASPSFPAGSHFCKARINFGRCFNPRGCYTYLLRNSQVHKVIFETLRGMSRTHNWHSLASEIWRGAGAGPQDCRWLPAERWPLLPNVDTGLPPGGGDAPRPAPSSANSDPTLPDAT